MDKSFCHAYTSECCCSGRFLNMLNKNLRSTASLVFCSCRTKKSLSFNGLWNIKEILCDIWRDYFAKTAVQHVK